MIEIRFHGRGGQGAVIASKILSVAFFLEDNYVQSFPVFGLERRGAPVAAFVRVDKSPIRLRANVYYPDFVVILDETLINNVNVTDGMKNGGTIIINSRKSPEEIDGFSEFRLATVDASSIAAKYGLGTLFTPIVNTPILGAFVEVSNLVQFESLKKAIEEEVLTNTLKNIQAAKESKRSCKLRGKNDRA